MMDFKKGNVFDSSGTGDHNQRVRELTILRPAPLEARAIQEKDLSKGIRVLLLRLGEPLTGVEAFQHSVGSVIYRGHLSSVQK